MHLNCFDILRCVICYSNYTLQRNHNVNMRESNSLTWIYSSKKKRKATGSKVKTELKMKRPI